MVSKEGHFRYSQRKKLNHLVGKEISVTECGQDFPSYSGSLIWDHGFYINGKQIPVRSLTPISKMDLFGRQIEVCSDYLTMGNLGRIVADFDIDALTTMEVTA